MSDSELVSLPKLPSRLSHLHLKCRYSLVRPGDGSPGDNQLESYIDACDWRCLGACTNLERLTLPAGHVLTGSL